MGQYSAWSLGENLLSFTGASIEVGSRPRVEAPVTALQSFSLQRNLSICLVKTIQQLTLNPDIPSSFLHCIQFNFTILIRMCNTITTIIIDVCLLMYVLFLVRRRRRSSSS